MMRRLLAGTVLVLLTGCGSGSSGATGAEAQLRRDVRTLTAAVAGHDGAAARSALATLTADADAAHRAGTISDAKLAAIRSAAAEVAGDLASATSTPPPTPTQTPTVSPSQPPAPPPAHDKGKGDGKGKGKGDGGD